MTWKGQLTKSSIPFKNEQEKILTEYFSKKPSRICVSAGAGTGKTTLLVEVFSETAIRLLEEDGSQNPFERILAVTFTVEATRQMKTKVRERMMEHFKDKPAELRKTLQWLESASWIMTLDSLTRQLLSEVALNAGIDPTSEMPDPFEFEKIRDEIFSRIEAEGTLQSDYDVVSKAFPEKEWVKHNPFDRSKGWNELLSEAFNKCRQYGIEAPEFKRRAIASFVQGIYGGAFEGKTDEKKLAARLLELGVRSRADLRRIKASYDLNYQILLSFCKLLAVYETEYTVATMGKKWMSYDDVRFLLLKYLRSKNDKKEEWLSSKRKRFEYVLVDEFQDTSYGQCAILSQLIGEDTSVFIIGDPKQSIFQWRQAEPGIFLEILRKIPFIDSRKTSAEILHLGISGFMKEELVSNYRSSGGLVDFFNDIFGEEKSSIFENPQYTGGYEIPHKNLRSSINEPQEVSTEPTVHPMNGGNADWMVIATELERIKLGKANGGRTISVRKERDGRPKWEAAKLGDCCVLLQSRYHWPMLRDELVRRGINYVMISDKGFFKRPEIGLVIDILDWLGNPHNKDALARILRSPLVGLRDREIRWIASNDFYLDKCLDNDAPKWFKDGAEQQIRQLICLRDDLRWSREGKKNEMVEKILGYCHLDKILLAHFEGDLAYANIRYLQDIIASWEDDELLTYPDLIEKLKFYRERQNDDQFSMAVLADDMDLDSVRIATVHAVKGLEFPVVFHLHCSRAPKVWQGELTISSGGEFILLKQIPPPSNSKDEWEDMLKPSKWNPTDRTSVYGRLKGAEIAERWRLFYVAMTRAKDHIFFDITKPRIGEAWSTILMGWYSEHNKDKKVEAPLVSQKPHTTALKKATSVISLDEKSYNRRKKECNTFMPTNLNGTHIYDLLFCPRRYQYSVLQEVQGGPLPIEIKEYDPELIGFGTKLHRALELFHFDGKASQEYAQYLSELKENDSKTAKAIQKAIDSLMKSTIPDELGLRKYILKREVRIAHMITDKATSMAITMKDKVDLVVEPSPNEVIIVDYKTNYPEGTSEWEEFVKKHYQYQLAAYDLAIREGAGMKVHGVFILNYDRVIDKWSLHKIDVAGIGLKTKLTKALPIRVENGGLARASIESFCRNCCHFREICE